MHCPFHSSCNLPVLKQSPSSSNADRIAVAHFHEFFENTSCDGAASSCDGHDPNDFRQTDFCCGSGWEVDPGFAGGSCEACMECIDHVYPPIMSIRPLRYPRPEHIVPVLVELQKVAAAA